MTIHYHGTPITPARVLEDLAGKCFCVSFADPRNVSICHRIGQMVMLDNGAFSLWKAGKPTNWPGYYEWTDEWLDFPATWAAIPDVIDGTEEENDALLKQWPFGNKGYPVWHMNEPVERLLRLADEYPVVCFGSSGEYSTVGTDVWWDRVIEAFEALEKRHSRTKPIHMLRGLSLAGTSLPFYSLDSTNIARNHHCKGNDALTMANRIDALQNPGRWTPRGPWDVRPQPWVTLEEAA